MSARRAYDSLEDTCDLKLVVVGDTRCGKTSLVQRFISDQFNETYIPTSFEKYSTSYSLCGCTVNFDIWDTSGSSSYDTVRPLAYQDAKAFLLCFSLMEPQSLTNAVTKWYPEIRSHCPNAPVILCGCGSDVKNGETLVTQDQALSVSRKISAITYVETSAKLTDKTIWDAFEMAALAATGKLKKKNTQKMYSQNGKSKVNLKTEIKSRTKSCSIM